MLYFSWKEKYRRENLVWCQVLDKELVDLYVPDKGLKHNKGLMSTAVDKELVDLCVPDKGLKYNKGLMSTAVDKELMQIEDLTWRRHILS